MEKLEKNYKKIAIVIIIIGILLRMVYISYTSIEERQHDMDGKIGHLGYIYTIYKTGELPTENKGQFYHPPLHHSISAGFLKLQTKMNIDLAQATENIQILTAIYSCITLIIIYLILNRVNIKKIYKIIIMTIMAVYPSFIILAGSINNDMLAIMFEFLIILYLLKWHEKTNIKNTILLGVFTAAALLTKVSTMIMGLPIAIVFIDKIILEIHRCKRHSFKKEDIIKIVRKYIIIFLLFGLISIGIGFAYIIRNLILFGQSPLYVVKVVDLYYCGDASFVDRFTLFSPEWIKDTYCNSKEECNIFAWIVRCSVLGEYADTSGKYIVLAQILKWTNAILIFIGLFSLIRVIIRQFIKKIRQKNNSNILREILLITYITMVVTYIYGVLSMPYGCTMDFRYIVPTAFLGITFIFMDLADSENKKYYNVYRIIVYLLLAILIIASVISVFTLTKYLQLV